MAVKSDGERKLGKKEDRKRYMREYQRKRRSKKRLLGSGLEGFLKAISGCPLCEHKPFAYLTEERFPVCKEHWEILADSDIEWGEEPKKELVPTTSPLGTPSYIERSA